MKIPRDIDGEKLIRKLKKFGYEPSRQTGSHVRLTLYKNKEEFHITIPLHKNLKIGTLSSILNEVSLQLNMDKDELLKQL